MQFSITGQEKGDLLIQVTAFARLTVLRLFVFASKLGVNGIMSTIVTFIHEI